MRAALWFVAVLGVAGCASDGGGASHSSAPAFCQPATDVSSFDSREAVTNALLVNLEANSSRTDAVLPAKKTIRATTTGTAPGDDLWALVGRHFGTTVARGGQRIGAGDTAYTGTIVNRSSGKRTYVVYQSVQVYSGDFASRCSGRRSTGTYITYGRIRQGAHRCGASETDDVTRMAGRYCA